MTRHSYIKLFSYENSKTALKRSLNSGNTVSEHPTDACNSSITMIKASAMSRAFHGIYQTVNTCEKLI